MRSAVIHSPLSRDDEQLVALGLLSSRVDAKKRAHLLVVFVLVLSNLDLAREPFRQIESSVLGSSTDRSRDQAVELVRVLERVTVEDVSVVPIERGELEGAGFPEQSFANVSEGFETRWTMQSKEQGERSNELVVCSTSCRRAETLAREGNRGRREVTSSELRYSLIGIALCLPPRLARFFLARESIARIDSLLDDGS